MKPILAYTVLTMILRISSARSMSFDLPLYGFDSYLDNPSDDMSPEEANCDPEGGASVTMEPPHGHGSPYQTSPSCDSHRDKDNCDANEIEMSMTRMKATHIAQNAAQVAKAANDAQAAAAQNASRQVKMQLADKAMAAARAADAVLEGKQNIVDNYAREIRESEAVVAQVSSSLDSSEADVDCACAAAKAAEAQAASFRILVEHTKATLTDIEGLIEQTNDDLDEKTQMLTAAKARGDRLARQVAQARLEYEQVREAACRAASAAVEAKQKASANNCMPLGGVGPPPPSAPPPPQRPGGCGVSSERGTCNALLDLYRQRRRQQLRQRRDKIRKRGIRGQGQSKYKDYHYSIF
ncbi:translation initiation factor IF-2 [Drosophila rhopaloa]|uniref:Translation initiation factor IF-2 n=1 Tax=Drosophila rhopaloa TaxID=1041015 RepID=A0A6P4EXW7_DRORH|nr:translation initiation factor IF-2 [Drosophila rhopaloa]